MKNLFRHPLSSILYSLFALCLLLPPSSFGQGSLTPPGPPAPTMKTLDQVEARTPISSLPFTISAPGSYYLTGNLTATGSQGGIIINSGEVTVDLMGFTIRRGVGGSGGPAGIGASDSVSNVTVRNGIVSGWTVGVSLAGRNTRVEGMTATNNGNGGGINCGASSVVVNCIASDNGGGGLVTGAGGLISQSASRGNGGDGISLGDGSTVQGCSASANTFNNILARSSCLIARNTAANGSFDGIRVVGDGSHLLENTCRTNAQNGIYVDGNDNRVEGNTSSRNATGIRIVKGFNLIIKNSAASNPMPDAGGGTSNYVIVTGNYIGKIAQLPASNSSGTNTGLGADAASPWANFGF